VLVVWHFLPRKMNRKNLLVNEEKLWGLGVDFIAGVDEVGRGALAGPLVAAAVILNSRHFEPTQTVISSVARNLYLRINDSKLLTPKVRQELSEFIINNAVSYSIQIIEPGDVDEWGISKATQSAFFTAVQKLSVKPQHVLVDAFPIKSLNRGVQTNIKHGDRLSISIAAASIIAKVFRDDLMRQYHKTYENYGFDRNKGYGTQFHLAALRRFGPCNIHRCSFSPLNRQSVY